MSESCSGFITSFVQHNDFIPRISYHNLELLQDDFFNTFERIKVPKIELYSHLRVPYAETHVASRNAKVLRSLEKDPLDSTFHQTVERFRAERETKNSTTIPLFIPGKIIHLVDASGDEKQGHYIPYWAKRSDFQLELTRRMYADHDIHSLVLILRDVCIDMSRAASLTIKPLTIVEDGDTDDVDDDVQLFSCRYHPYGRLPTVLSLLGVAVFVITGLEANSCDFLCISIPPSTMYDAVNKSKMYGRMNMTLGLWLYELLDCDNTTGSCSEVEDYFHSESYPNNNCQPYPKTFDVGQFTHGSRVLYAIAFFWFGLAVFMIMVSVLFVYEQWTWMLISIMLLAGSLLRTLTLFFIIQIDTNLCSGSCHAHLGRDAVISMVICAMCFIMALGAGYLAKVGKKKKPHEVDILSTMPGEAE